MTKRSLRQKNVVSYALLRGKLIPRDEVLKQRLGLDNQSNNELKSESDDSQNSQMIDFEQKSAKELKALLDGKGVEYKGNASKDELIELLKAQEHSDFEIKGGE